MYGEGVFDYSLLSFEWLSEHCIFRENLGSVVNIFTVLELILSQGYLLSAKTISERKMFLFHILSSGCVRFCTVRITEHVILNLGRRNHRS